jgi:hypothetical protein
MAKETFCLWCHRTNEEPLEQIACDGEAAFVHPSHRQPLEQYCRETAEAKWRFLGGIGVSILLGVVAELLAALTRFKMPAALLAGVAAAVCAVTLYKFPFATPETLAFVGVRKSITMTRSCAVVILVLGVGLAVYGLTL